MGANVKRDEPCQWPLPESPEPRREEWPLPRTESPEAEVDVEIISEKLPETMTPEVDPVGQEEAPPFASSLDGNLLHAMAAARVQSQTLTAPFDNLGSLFDSDVLRASPASDFSVDSGT